MILTALKSGELARIVAIEGGHGLRQNLLLHGISEENTVRMVSSNRGPVVLEINGSTIAIGRGMAKKIIVQK